MESIVNQIDYGIGTLNAMLSKLWGLPYLTTVAILCFVVGLFLRHHKTFPNAAVPLVVIVCGAVFAPLLADPRADTLPLRIWVAKNVVVGIIIGIVTWVSHRYALKPLARKVPWLWWIAPENGDRPCTETSATSTAP